MINDFVKESRPQTLLLGATNCALGCGLGFYYGAVNAYTLAAAFFITVTGVLLQVLSNLANDYGDAVKGSDGAGRLGPIRGAMTGAVTLADLKRFMAIVISVLSITGMTAVYMTLSSNPEAFAWFVFFGVMSVFAAICYTVGLAYGYRALGDVSVFIFFGILAVLGPQLMLTNAGGMGMEIYPDAVLISFSVGASSVMVLHTANMRDIEEDRKNNKKTLAVLFGPKGSSVYLGALLLFTVICSFGACFTSHKGWQISILALSVLPLASSAWRVMRNADNGRRIAPELKFTLLGCAIHNLAWMLVLLVDFWVYF